MWTREGVYFRWRVMDEGFWRSACFLPKFTKSKVNSDNVTVICTDTDWMLSCIKNSIVVMMSWRERLSVLYREKID